jgi:hypothetical protein
MCKDPAVPDPEVSNQSGLNEKLFQNATFDIKNIGFYRFKFLRNLSETIEVFTIQFLTPVGGVSFVEFFSSGMEIEVLSIYNIIEKQ